MLYLLLFIYIVVFGWFIKKSSLFNIDELSKTFILLIFISKIVAGLVYGIIHKTYFLGGDTFYYLNECTLIGETFFKHPYYYIGSLLGWEVALPHEKVFTYPDGFEFWKNLGTYVVVHIHAFLHLFTRGHYELHIFFIAILNLIASLNFYKVFSKILDLPKIALICCCFFLPSLTFWTSGLHKDAYIYFGLSFFVLGLLELQTNKKSSSAKLKILLGFLTIGIIRHYLLALLIPATIAYSINIRYPKKVWLCYTLTYSFCIFLGIIVSQLLFNINVLSILANQQTAFLAEIGGSKIINAEPFEPSIWGIITTFPFAIINVIARPFLWECKDFLQIMASIEILCFLILLAFSVVVRRQSIARPNLLIHFLVAYAISNLLLIGVLVSNIGTIARYRAIALGILSTLLSLIFDFYGIDFFKKRNLNQSKKSTNSPPIHSNKKENASIIQQ